MKLQTLVLAFAFVLIASGSAFAQSNMLRGKVRAANGVTVNNAIVELRNDGGAMVSQTVTHNDGDFAFSNLSGGEYEVTVNIAGYEPAVQMARFNQNDRSGFSEVINIEVLIRPKKVPALAPPGGPASTRSRMSIPPLS